MTSGTLQTRERTFFVIKYFRNGVFTYLWERDMMIVSRSEPVDSESKCTFTHDNARGPCEVEHGSSMSATAKLRWVLASSNCQTEGGLGRDRPANNGGLYTMSYESRAHCQGTDRLCWTGEDNPELSHLPGRSPFL